ncbi:MAG: ABC transporter permease [Candidatus Cloacimonadota bacterium]|nr:MAG: ABC transporter permease [Candidatus Cloacimonadota bacterium]PIE78159.1 MAG: ABC transporter permease [Candidatus Delongbacteria bacterium]
MLTTFLAATVVAGTPLLFAILGELITEKAGKLNLGVEGMMLLGAVSSFLAVLYTESPYFSLLAAMLAGASGAFIFAFLTISLRANQVVTGLALTIFGTGVSSFLGKDLMGLVVPDSVKLFFKEFKIPFLGDIPVIGEAFFNQGIFVYLGYLSVILVGIYLFNTRFGLYLRAIGENNSASDAAGIGITLYKYVHVLIGGALCGLAGAYLSLVYVPSWQENVTAGRGWIAVALVIFSKWSPYRALLGAFIFGGLDIIGFRLQKFEIHISQYLIDMLPYLVTIIILVLASIRKSKESSPPAELGNSYYREDR